MAKTLESNARGRKLRRSRNVSSFLEESTESATPPKTTVNVVVDVHSRRENSNRQQRQQSENENDLAVELSDDKEIRRPFASSKASSRTSETSRETRDPSKDLLKRSGDELPVEVLDLTNKFEEPRRKSESSLGEKPRRRKQWNTVTSVTNEAEVDRKRPPRKRWSKDTGVIRLPETGDEVLPFADDPHKVPVPAPRISIRRSNALSFDNPTFVSENEDEVLRVETDHRRESTKIEMRRLSDRSNVEDTDKLGTTSSSSSRKHRGEVAVTRERFVTDSEERFPRTRSSESRRNSVAEADTSASLERIADIRSNSIASEERTSSERKSRSEGKLRRGPSRRRERSSLRNEEPPGDEELVSSSARDVNSSAETNARVRSKRRKKRKSDKEGTKGKGEMKYISVTIHRADMLEANYMNAKRPMVRVHIVEASTGSYLKNTMGKLEGNGGAYLQPMITGKFDFRENRSMIPAWEEELVFEYNFDAIARREDSEQVVILFEVIDLLSFAEASLSYDRVGSEGCWNKIAWAFLKPVGVNNTLHIDKKVRLQLYKPKRSKKYGKHKCEVYTWWQSNNRDKYPSSLLVTVTSVPPSKLKPVLYQQFPLNDLVDNARSDSRGPSTRTSDSLSLPKWARLAAQSCKIPNEKMFETDVSENGCFYIAFSNDGKYLACVHSEEYNYPIAVYEVETGKIHVRFLGHKTFVYSLNWSNNDHHLLSASADQTARIWDVRNQIVQHIEMLPHPSYVYCAKYGPGKATIVATGCYDRVARVWANDRRSRKRELCQELEGHEGFVNSMVFQKSGNLITADSVGTIILWTVRRNSRMTSKREWRISKKIKIDEIEGIVINTIALHPLESRLLVHSRNNGLQMLDLATGVVLQKYKQLNNQRIQLKACISPCGGLIICGGEDSVLNIWNLETGKHLAKYTNDGRSSVRAVITCVDYHPYDHVMAFSIFGSPTSVRVLRYNKDVNGGDVGLNLTEDVSQERSNEVILNVLGHFPCRRVKTNGGTTVRKGISLPHRSAIDHTIIEIENGDHEQPWTTLRRLREIERSWRERSRNRLHSIIERIDSMLSRNSMFTDDVIEGERTFNVNDRRGSWTIIDNVSSNNVLTRDMLFENDAANSIMSCDDPLGNGNNAQSSSTTRSNSRNHSFNLRNSMALFEKVDTLESSHLSSPNSAATYTVETPDFNENVDEIAIVAEEIDSVQRTAGSDSSQASNATFVIENEQTSI